MSDEDARRAQRTYERAVGLLAVSARSARDLARALVDKGEPEDLVAQAIARLTEAGLLSDARYAAGVTRARVMGRGQSPRRVEHELARRGVDRTEARAVVAQVMADEGATELDAAVMSARKKLKTLAGKPPEAQRQKLYGWLARQGFGSAAVRHALRVALAVDPPDSAADEDGEGEGEGDDSG